MQIIHQNTNGFTRIVEDGGKFEVQTLRIRSEHKLGALTYWHTLAGFWDQMRAFKYY